MMALQFDLDVVQCHLNEAFCKSEIFMTDEKVMEKIFDNLYSDRFMYEHKANGEVSIYNADKSVILKRADEFTHELAEVSVSDYDDERIMNEVTIISRKIYKECDKTGGVPFFNNIYAMPWHEMNDGKRLAKVIHCPVTGFPIDAHYDVASEKLTLSTSWTIIDLPQ